MSDPASEPRHKSPWEVAEDNRAVASAERRPYSFKRIIGNLLLAVIALAVVSFFAAPMVTFFAIRSAAESSDVAGLARLIDFGQVRTALRPQLTPEPTPQALQPAPSFLDDPIGAVRRRFQDNPIIVTRRGPDIDAWLTPNALAGLTSGEGRAATLASPAVTEPRRAPFPRPRYWGVDRARLAVVRDGASTVFTFERRGLYEWKLVHIGLPARRVSPASTTP